MLSSWPYAFRCNASLAAGSRLLRSAPLICPKRESDIVFRTFKIANCFYIYCESCTLDTSWRRRLQAAMGRTTPLARFIAVMVMLATNGDAKAALPMFKACAQTKSVKEGTEFLGRWWERYQRCEEKENFLVDKKRSGRPKLIDDAVADECAAAFKKKTPVHGRRRHYNSVAEVGTGQLACAGWRCRALSAMQHSRASPPKHKQLSAEPCGNACRHAARTST